MHIIPQTIGTIVGLILANIIIDFMWPSTYDSEWQHEAIIHHAAHYEVDSLTGKTKFVWNNP